MTWRLATRRACLSATFALLAACATGPARQELTLPSTSADSPSAKFVREGFSELRAGRYDAAARSLNRALALAPNQSGLHVLVGIAYHLDAVRGNPASADLAEIGYSLAAELDPSNHLAQLQLGRLYLDGRRYSRAQEAFARVLEVERDSAEAAYGLAVASYYARDLGTALGSIRLAERLRPAVAEVQRAGALIRSALGLQDEARAARARFASLASDTDSVTQLDRRMEQWRQLHQDPMLQQAQLAPAFPAQGAAPTPSPGPQPGKPIALHWGDCLPGSQLPTAPSGGLAGSDETVWLPALPSPCSDRPMPRMAMIDAAIIRTEESVNTAKGINLLQGLQLVFGYGRTATRTETTGVPTTQTIVTTRSVGLPLAGVAYSLNIANASDLRTDVLARPTLVALDRVPSQFFSGTNLTIAIPGQLAGGSVVEKPIGVSLSVTPTFVDDDTMLLSIKAARSDVEIGAPGTFDQSLHTTRNMVTASVMLKFDQTLILSGMLERETTVSKSGAPVLRDVPLLQYLFSTGTSEELQKSILITLTPRRPALSASGPAAGTERPQSGDPLLAELRERLGREYTLPQNALATMRVLAGNRHVSQFRSGDLKGEDWRSERSLDNFLRTLLLFLHY